MGLIQRLRGLLRREPVFPEPAPEPVPAPRPVSIQEWAKQRFFQDVAEHEMQVLHDCGVYRHIRFKKPGTGMYHFDLVTWPGYLSFSGDMGALTFSRLRDMFEFFRTKTDRDINPYYWGEKLVGPTNGRDGVLELDKNLFKKEVLRDVEERLEYLTEDLDAEIREEIAEWERADQEEPLSESEKDELVKERAKLVALEEAREALRDDVKWKVLCDPFNNHEAHSLVYDYEYEWLSGPLEGETFRFEDSYEMEFRDFSFPFLWACYAIQWGVQQYDAARSK